MSTDKPGPEQPKAILYTQGRRPTRSHPQPARNPEQEGGASSWYFTPGRRPDAPPGSERTASSELPVSGGTGAESTTVVLYIHGIANKPPASVLKCQWDMRLFDIRLGQRSRMAYWVNRRRYPTPLSNTCNDSDLANRSFDLPELEFAVESVDPAPLPGLPGIAVPAREILQRIARRMEEATAEEVAESQLTSGYQPEVLPLPPTLRRWVTRRLTSAFLPDVHDYLFDPRERERIDDAVLGRMAAGNRFVIVAHSLGTVIAYQVLAALQRQNRAPDVPLLVTLGSPLGMTEVQDGLKNILGVRNLPELTTVQRWLNVSDRLDPVAVDSRLRGEYQCAGPLIDVTGFNVNRDGPRDPHSATGYLSHARVREEVRAVLGTEYSEEVTRFTVARDVADWIEDAPPSSRQEVLIELRTSDGYGVEESRLRLMHQLALLLGSDLEKYCVPLQRFLAIQLTAGQIERLGAFFQEHRYGRIWKDSEKSAHTDRSVTTIHAPTAWRGYQALGQNIHWAILDTGIRPDHPHFHVENNIASVWDCTNHGPHPVENSGRDARGAGIDRHGHGTHVAGVVAGRFPTANHLSDDGEPSGIAPQTKLHSYKVLDDDGRGRDSWIIKAVQHIEEVNRRAGSLTIHGVNLSLGGDFDPEVYACGHSPLCTELRRLWRQGVVVVTSAGNLGSLTIDAGAGRQVRLNLDLSIGDPANLEEAISVGSVHKTEARLFGISYFSSRGPTADGRYKPDVVAPGERILSARAAFPDRGELTRDNRSRYYVEMSGTSMAAPHVSGLLAAFLSQRRGYLGRPDELRRVLIDNCTDLGRDRYHQGAGVPNLIRMLLSANS